MIKQIEVNTDTIVIGSFVIKQVEVNTDTIVMGSFIFCHLVFDKKILKTFLW